MLNKPITLICPRLTCRAILQVPDGIRGQRVRCAECGATFVVPVPKRSRPQARSVPAATKSAAG